jgi:N-acyl-D-amino-acid deacylase
MRPGSYGYTPILLIILVLAVFASADGQGGGYDLLIRDARVLDGTGNPWFRADVAVRDGRIAAIGDLRSAVARRVVDAHGRVLAPGFIDLHSHARKTRPGWLRTPDPRRRAAPNLVAQGVTTVVVNQDGRSPWPIAEQRAVITRRGTGPNVLLLAGHGTLRGLAMGGDFRRAATPAEVREMRRLLRQAMAEGAVGLSAGLEYVPGRWSTTEELVELVREVAVVGGVYISHQRSEGSDPMWYLPSRDPAGAPTGLDAVRETIAIGERTGATVVASHIKMKGVDLWGTSDSVIVLVRAARDRGVSIYGDSYPYTTSGSDGDTRLIPDWVFGAAAGRTDRPSPRDQLRGVLAIPSAAARLRADVTHEIHRRGGADHLVVFDHPDPRMVGRNLAELARQRGTDPVEAALALQLEGYADRPGGARIRGFSMSQADVDRFAAEPWVATASDAGIALPEDGPVHARFYGTFPRALARTALERGVVPLEHAIRSMTSLPAQILGLQDRGLIRVGLVADLVLFDPERLADMATFVEPHAYPRGIDHVWVGGRAVVEGGRLTWALPGAVLTRAPRPRASL